MTGLILKDILCLRKVMKSYALIFAVYAVLALTGVWSVSFLAGFLMILVTVLPSTCFSLDHAAKWEAYGLSLPVSRGKTVAARYLTLFLLMIAGTAVSAAVGAGLVAVGRETDLFELLAAGGVCLVLGVLANSVMLPLLYLFGAERARIVFYSVFLAIGGLVALSMVALVTLDEPEGSGFREGLAGAVETAEDILAVSPWLIAVCVAAVCAVLLGVSFLISCAIFKRKEM